MEPTHNKAKDFFLHLGAMVGLYSSAIAFINLLFSVIDKIYTPIGNFYYYRTPNISLPVATLIVVFPIFILISYLIEKEINQDPTKKDYWVRRWSIYITLFISGIILVSNLVMVLYKFIDGQDLTTGFLLKSLVIVSLMLVVFGYYLQNIREKISGSRKKFWAVFSSILVLISIVFGFSIIGSPKTQRLMRVDEETVSSLQNLQWKVIDYWQVNGKLPKDMPNIKEGLE